MESIELKELKELKELINSIPQMIWKINNNGVILYSNKIWDEYTNNNKYVFDINLLHTDDIDKVKKIWNESSNIFTVKRRLKNSQGIFRWFLTKAIKISDNNWVGICTDIEEMVIAEETRLDLAKQAKLLAQNVINKENEKEIAEETRLDLAKEAKLLAQNVIDKQNEKEIAEETRIDLAKVAKLLAQNVIDKQNEKEIAEGTRTNLAKEAKLAEETRANLAKVAKILAQNVIDKEYEKEIAEKTRIDLEKEAKILAEDVILANHNRIMLSNKAVFAEKIRLDLENTVRILEEDAINKENEKNSVEIIRKALSNHTKVLAEELVITNKLVLQLQLDQIKIKKDSDIRDLASIDNIAEMSHEIRNSINGVLGIISLMSDTHLESELREYICTLKDEGIMILNVMNDIMDYAKLNSNKLQIEYIQFNPNELLTVIYKMYLPLITNKGLSFYIKKNNLDDNRIIKCDPHRIKQILTNLLSNALKFTFDGSITIKFDLKKNYILFSIIDTGIGITEENLEKLFQKYTQSDESVSRIFGGTGLGLSICKKLVTLMNGEINATSEINKGSTFWFKVPVK